jgi:hypothetical protein
MSDEICLGNGKIRAKLRIYRKGFAKSFLDEWHSGFGPSADCPTKKFRFFCNKYYI